MKSLFLLFGCCLIFSGCVAPTRYSWGSYEPMLYKMYTEPSDATPDLQIIKLEEDIQKARSKDKPLPPGFYAHLGYLYVQRGDLELARRAFITEKETFPESAIFMDRLMLHLQ